MIYVECIHDPIDLWQITVLNLVLYEVFDIHEKYVVTHFMSLFNTKVDFFNISHNFY